MQEGCDLGMRAAVLAGRTRSHLFSFWIEGDWVNEEVPVAFVCCSRCGYSRRQRGPERRPFGRPAEPCPSCNLKMYWTDWLDPRRFMRLARLDRLS